MDERDATDEEWWAAWEPYESFLEAAEQARDADMMWQIVSDVTEDLLPQLTRSNEDPDLGDRLAGARSREPLLIVRKSTTRA